MNLPTRLDAFACASRRVFLSFYIHGSMVNRVKGLGANFHVYMYANG